MSDHEIAKIHRAFQQNRSLSVQVGVENPVCIFLDLTDPEAMRIALALEEHHGEPGRAAREVRQSEARNTLPTMVSAGPREGISALLRRSSPQAAEKILTDPPAGYFYAAWVANGRTKLMLVPVDEPQSLPSVN